MYELKDNQILVKKGMEFVDTFKSIAQELALAEVVRDTNNVPDNPQFSSYCAAYMLCKKHGVDTQDFSFSDAPDALEGLEPQDIKTELSQIRDAAESISGRMAKHLDTVTKAAKSQEER